jgi:hypothetical protein
MWCGEEILGPRLRKSKAVGYGGAITARQNTRVRLSSITVAKPPSCKMEIVTRAFQQTMSQIRKSKSLRVKTKALTPKKAQLSESIINEINYEFPITLKSRNRSTFAKKTPKSLANNGNVPILRMRNAIYSIQ